MKNNSLLIFLLSFLIGNTLILSATNKSYSTLKEDEVKKMMDFPQKEEVVKIIQKVNQYWQSKNPIHGNSFWNRAAYHTGNVAAYEVTNDISYLDFSIAWAEHNEWKGAKSDNKADWKYTYGESEDYVLFGDYQACFQVYTDLYEIFPDERKIARAKEVMEYQMSTDQNDYWWWADGLYMVMPVMTRLYKITGNATYLEKLHEYWQYANSIMYDEEEGLYYRDANYVYPEWKTGNGKKDFWSRGNGWVFAALVRVLDDLPKTDQYRETYIAYYKKMAKRLAEAQQDGGYWTRSLIDPSYVPGEETSGTAFFAYGFLWGINNGYLSEEDYGDVVSRVWNYLTNTALQEDGRIGYVQPIGAHAVPGQYIDANSTADFGVGAFLLAASEMIKYADGEMPVPAFRISAVSLEEAKRMKVVFNLPLDIESAKNINNYKVNGATINGSILYDGNRTVTIEFFNSLDYGVYAFNVEGLLSESGALLEKTADRIFSLTVPLTPEKESIVVAATGSQYPNFPENTLDNNLDTRWSQQGYEQWIKYDLGKTRRVNGVDLAFYQGNRRNAYFEIELSEDDNTYTKVFVNGESSGTTTELERYNFADTPARYVKIIFNGTSLGDWNSITEARVRYVDLSAIQQIERDRMVYLFPNLIKNVLIIDNNIIFDEKIELFMYDSLGKIVMETALKEGKNTLNCSSLKSDCYIVNIKSKYGVYHQKIIKH